MTLESLRESPCDLIVRHPEGERTLICDITAPEKPARGTLVIAHGFKGYKDYGMLPHLAWTVALQGWAAVRFNFAHSGMTRSYETFERPDLFALDTWNRQVADLEQLVDAIRGGRLLPCPETAPVLLFGHSRGGLASILAAGRGLAVQAVVSASAPKAPLRFSDADLDRLRSGVACPVESSRTGQMLSIGRHFLDEVEAEPEQHDPCRMAARMQCPLTVVHGDSDQTVSCDDAVSLADAGGTRAVLLDGGDHVYNVTNPLGCEEEGSPQLAALEDVVLKALDASERAC